MDPALEADLELASIVIEATVARVITSSNAYASLLDLKQKLDGTKTPKANRSVTVNSVYMRHLLEAGVVTRDTESDTKVIRNGFVTRIAGFDLFENEGVLVMLWLNEPIN